MNEVSSRKEEEEAASALEEAIRSRNYLHAETLARHLGRPEAEVRELQEEAFRQQVLEFRNPQGTVALVEEFGFSREDIIRLLKVALEESVRAKEKDKSAHTARFDMESMGYLSLEEWIKRYFKL